jgi:class 3 adenylate cyclase/tetratricopeptide (TPR) repeat protein
MAEARKIVTVVFADVVGSTALGEALDPETVRHMMERYFAEARAALERHGGMVEKFIGDAVVAVFGMPAAHEDDALRAVRAAAEMRERLAALNEELARAPGVHLDVRTGVNTGEVVVGDPEGGHFFATGDAVNVAARLEQAAGPGEVLLGALTQRLVREAVRSEALEPLALKGRDELVKAFRLLEVLPGVPAFTHRLDTRFVGRASELGVLQDALYRTQREGTCELVTVVGAPGIGKSRLAREFLASLGTEARVLIGRCLSYGEGITYWPLVEIVGQATGADPRRGLEELLAAEEEGSLAVERLAAALGLVNTPTPSEEIFWAVRILFEKLARERPLVVVVDDIHWAEATFLDLVEYLLGFAAGPLLLLACARPDLLERRPEWSRPRPRATTLLLHALGGDDADLLVDELLPETGLDDELRRRIVQAAEGNPLFLEQMLALAREDPDGEITIPPTIQALLAERLDRLPPAERAIAEAASVEGRLFHRGTVSALLPKADRELLAAGLLALVRKELVRPDRSEFGGDDGFRFAHILIRDAAYASLPKGRRAELHEQVGLLFESRSLPEEVAGYHLEQAALSLGELGAPSERADALASRASDLLAAAGQRAAARGDQGAAANLLRRARTLLLPDDPRLPPLGLVLADALYEVGELRSAEAISRETLTAATALGDKRTKWLTIIWRVSFHAERYEPGSWSVDEARRSAQDALAVFEGLDDAGGLAQAWLLLGEVDWYTLRYDAAAKAFEKAIVLARQAEDERQERTAVAWLAGALYYGATPVPEAIARVEELTAQALGSELEAAGLVALAGLHAMQGNFEEGRVLYERSKEIRRQLGLTFMMAANTLVARDLYLLAGNAEEAERELHFGYDVLEKLGDKGARSTLAAYLADALYRQERYVEAEHFVRACFEAASPEDVASQVPGRAVRAKLLAVKGKHDPAEQDAREAVGLVEETDDLVTRALAQMALAEVLLLAHRDEEAVKALEAAADASDRKGNIVTAEKARSMIASLRPARPTDVRN